MATVPTKGGTCLKKERSKGMSKTWNRAAQREEAKRSSQRGVPYQTNKVRRERRKKTRTWGGRGVGRPGKTFIYQYGTRRRGGAKKTSAKCREHETKRRIKGEKDREEEQKRRILREV